MTKAIFIFIAILLVVSPIISHMGIISPAYQLVVCLPFILLFGIPHGAIDNILYLRDNQIKNNHFISIYLILVGINILLWLIAPEIAYVAFLTLSAYHFGQSQFSHYFKEQPLIHKILYLSWGVTILSGLINFNLVEINQIITQQSDFAALGSTHQSEVIFPVFLMTTCGTIALMVFLLIKKTLSPENFLMEILVLILVLSCFYLMPLLIGFTLYFTILHSIKVLKEEFGFLTAEERVNSISSFIKMVAPFTFLSIAGIATLFLMIHLSLLPISYGYGLLIVISSITLPHVFVMDAFYDRIFQRNLTKWLS